VTFVDKDGSEHTVAATVGKSLLEVAHAYEIDLEGASLMHMGYWALV